MGVLPLEAELAQKSTQSPVSILSYINTARSETNQRHSEEETEEGPTAHSTPGCQIQASHRQEVKLGATQGIRTALSHLVTTPMQYDV